MTIRIDRIGDDDGPLFRAVRLRALTDAPTSFGGSLDETLARSDEFWVLRAAAAAGGDDQAIWFARDDDRVVGLVGAYVPDAGTEPRLVSMWVDPASRGRGVGARLIDAVVAWAVDVGAGGIVLDVESSNVAARSLYERAGFRPTGRSASLPSDPSLTTDELRREL